VLVSLKAGWKALMLERTCAKCRLIEYRPRRSFCGAMDEVLLNSTKQTLAYAPSLQYSASGNASRFGDYMTGSRKQIQRSIPWLN
jgi:hypothetical protein